MLLSETAAVLRLSSGIQKGYRVRVIGFEGNFDGSAERRGGAAVGMMVLMGKRTSAAMACIREIQQGKIGT